MGVQRIRLDQHSLQIQLAEKLLEVRVLVALVRCVAALSDGQAQCCRVERHLGNERCPAASGRLDRAAKRFAVTNQLVKIRCTAWDLGQSSVMDGRANGRHIHLQEEVAKG